MNKLFAGLALVCLAAVPAFAQNVTSPSGNAPAQAIAYGALGTPFTPVDDDHGLPVRIMSGAGAGGGAGTEYAEDAAAPANPVGGTILCRRRDTLSTSEVSADLDWIAINCTSKGQVHVFAELVTGTTVGLTGSLPGFASPPTVNFGTLNGAATTAKQDVLAALVGEAQLTPTAYTLLDRLKTLDADMLALKALVGTVSDVYDGTNGKTLLGYGRATADQNLSALAVATKPQAQTTGGCTPYGYQSAASTNSTLIAAGQHTLCALNLENTTATLYYVRVYDSGTAPTCSSPTGFKFTLAVPANTTGAGIAANLGPFGMDFAAGPAFCITGGPSSTDNTNAATGVFVVAAYK